jgi:hypothetical protein
MEEEPLNTAVEEGAKTFMHDVPVESALPIRPVFQSTTEAQYLQKPDRIVSSGRTLSVEPPGFDLHFKTNAHRTQFHRTTSIGTTARRRLLQRNLPRRLFHAAGEKSLLPQDSGVKRGGLSLESIPARRQRSQAIGRQPIQKQDTVVSSGSKAVANHNGEKIIIGTPRSALGSIHQCFIK